MTSRPFAAALAILLTITLIAPAAFFVEPPKAHAYLGILDTNLIGDVENTIAAIKNTLTAANTYTSSLANYAQYVNTYVLEPLAFVLSGNLLKSMTAGIVAFVNGQANGTGVPQFVQDLQGNLQTVGDIQTRTFLNQFNANSNSPFASAITSSLRTDYLQQTSLAGFFAKNQCTLDQASPNTQAFLAGDWSQGGTGAWFALTTQNQNNPYTLYQSSQSELSNMIAGATEARLSELNWGQGFLSWCGDSTTNAGSNPSTATSASGATNASATVGAPGDACTKSDGTPGVIKTPGSVIKASLDKALGTTFDKLVNMGNASAEISGIMGNIATVLNTVNFATQILGGSGSGGLFGIGQSSGGNGGSTLSQYRNSPDYLGTSQSGIYQTASTLPFSGSDMLTRISQYETAWNTIKDAANAASSSLTDLINYCTPAADTGAATIISNAQSALTNEIAPVFAQVDAAFAATAAARAMVSKVQAELTSNTNNGTGGAYTADLQTLQTMTPTNSDVANAQQQAQVFGAASAHANPTDTLSVSGISMVDTLNLISANAQALKSSCTITNSAIGSGGG